MNLPTILKTGGKVLTADQRLAMIQKVKQGQKPTVVKADPGPVPNRLAYKDTAFKDWKPGMRVPKCRVCEGVLYPEENHVCSGFVPKYVEHDGAWHERPEAKRAEIRESNYNRPKKCIGCDQVIHDEDEARWHDEHCREDMPRGKHWYTDHDPIVGDNDGHECYEDYVEPDYCEGDDDEDDCD
jgi:hypothetical protein